MMLEQPLKIDHVTFAGAALAPLEQIFAELGLATDYGVLPGLVRAAGGHRRWLVTRWVEGRTAKERGTVGEVLDPQAAPRLLASLAAGLDHLHRRGVVHRDVKPDNMMFTENREFKLVDLGLAVIRRTRAGRSPFAPARVVVSASIPSYMLVLYMGCLLTCSSRPRFWPLNQFFS